MEASECEARESAHDWHSRIRMVRGGMETKKGKTRGRALRSSSRVVADRCNGIGKPGRTSRALRELLLNRLPGWPLSCFLPETLRISAFPPEFARPTVSPLRSQNEALAFAVPPFSRELALPLRVCWDRHSREQPESETARGSTCSTSVACRDLAYFSNLVGRCPLQFGPNFSRQIVVR